MAPDMVVTKASSLANIQVLTFTAQSVPYTPPQSFPPQLASFNVRAPFGDGDVIMIMDNLKQAISRCPKCKSNKTGSTVVASETIRYRFEEFWVVEYVGDPQQGMIFLKKAEFELI